MFLPGVNIQYNHFYLNRETMTFTNQFPTWSSDKVMPTHMLLYLMMEPTITATPPTIANAAATAAELVTRAVLASEYVFHS